MNTSSTVSEPSRPGAEMSLPVVGSAPRIKPSRFSRRRAWVLIGVHLLIALHLTHWKLAGRTLSPLELAEGIDFGRRGLINAGALFFGLAILSTLLLGRFFCGWGCHLIALQDLCRWLLGKAGLKPKPLRSRLLLWVPLFAFLYMFIWPLFHRLLITDLPFATRVELTRAGFWDTFPGWFVGGFTFLICGFVAVYVLGSKGFCTYGCPYGGIFGVVDRLAPGRIRVTQACDESGHCTAVCGSNVRVHEEVRDYGMVVDPGCMKCMDCVSVCPNEALYFGFGKPAWGAKPAPKATPPRSRGLAWWEEAVLAAAFLTTFFIVNGLSDGGLYHLFPFLLSLGFSATMAYLILIGVRLLKHANVRLQSWTLKRGGRWTRGGFAYGGLMGLIATAGGYGLTLRVHTASRDRAYHQFRTVAYSAASKSSNLASASSQTKSAWERALSHARLLDRQGAWLEGGLRALLSYFSVKFPGFRGNAENDFILADLYLFDGNTQRTEEYLRQALECAPGVLKFRLELAQFLAGQGKPDQAVEVLQPIQPGRPFHPREVKEWMEAEFIDLAWLLASQGREREGRNVLALYAEAAPGRVEGWLVVGRRLAQSARLESAKRFYEDGLRHAPDDARFYHDLAVVAGGERNFDQAIVHFQRALELDGERISTRRMLAEAFLVVKRHEEAARQLREVVRLRPDLSETHFRLGQVEVELGNAEAAERHFKMAARLAPLNVGYHVALAQFLNDRGKVEEARLFHQKAIQLDPRLAPMLLPTTSPDQ